MFIERTGVVFRGCLKKCQDRSLRRLKRLSWWLLRRESTIYGIRRKQDPKKKELLNRHISYWCSMAFFLYSVGVRWLISCFKTTTFCQLQHCRNSPKTMIYCMQDWKRFHHHRSNEYIMVSNALGGVNGSRLSRHFPLRRRPVPTGIASWLTWRCTRSLQLLRLVITKPTN